MPPAVPGRVQPTGERVLPGQPIRSNRGTAPRRRPVTGSTSTPESVVKSRSAPDRLPWRHRSAPASAGVRPRSRGRPPGPPRHRLRRPPLLGVVTTSRRLRALGVTHRTPECPCHGRTPLVAGAPGARVAYGPECAAPPAARSGIGWVGGSPVSSPPSLPRTVAVVVVDVAASGTAGRRTCVSPHRVGFRPGEQQAPDTRWYASRRWTVGDSRAAPGPAPPAR